MPMEVPKKCLGGMLMAVSMGYIYKNVLGVCLKGVYEACL